MFTSDLREMLETPKWIFIALSSAASAGIAVSQRKVRQISDPIQQILIQLHKVIYITQVSLAGFALMQPILFC